MTAQDIVFWSAAETAAAVRSRQVSPVEVVQAYLDRIDRLDSKLNAYITVCGEEALAAARDMESSVYRGETSGGLLGVPIAVKDQFWTKGIPTTNGSRVYEGFVTEEDSTVIKRIKAAGAVLIGKLNMAELAMGGTQNPPYGIPRNPWDLERTPGDSSSGSGVALAAHLCAASVGEDTGGSGRGPAAYCGVTGLRPTFTRVSRYGMTAMCWYMDAAAPMTKRVEDCALVLGAIAGHDPKDPFTSRRPVPPIAGLSRVTKAAEEKGINLCVELLNSKVNHPDYQCDTTAWGVEVCKGVGSPRAQLLYDIYHMQIMEGDLIRNITDYSEYIGHYHTAGNPGRHDLDDEQEIYYPAVMRAIVNTGYDLYVGHEFSPKGDALDAMQHAYDVCNV